MLSPLHPHEAEEISPKKLAIPKARELADFLQRPNVPFVRFIRCEKISEFRNEAVIFEVDVELGQRKIHQIHEVEQIGVVFDPNDKTAPEVLALREDFPVTPHQNMRVNAPPRCLCLDEDEYPDQKLRWSPLSFVERIREWLRLTAVAKLHDPGQPLEQLLGATEGTIILPHDYLRRFNQSDPTATHIALINGSTEKPILRFWGRRDGASDGKPRVVPMVLATDAMEHGPITEQPANLYALHEFCRKAKFDLMRELAGILRDWIENEKGGDIHNGRLALILLFPKKRDATTVPEETDVWVFLTKENIGEIALALGVEAQLKGYKAVTLNFGGTATHSNEALARQLTIYPFRPVFELNAKKAAVFNGFASPVDKNIAAVGMGALGSQVFNNMVRSGFGRWALVDKDVLLPHNCARHALFGNFVGICKAHGLAAMANSTIAGGATLSIAADIFNPGDQESALCSTFENADIIFDFSASVPAARHLGDEICSKARRASVFLNPSGTDSVILMEDSKRKFRLTSLEMEYYRLLASEPTLRGHLADEGGKIRYARSCGDITSRISQNHVALHAAIGSQFLRTFLEQDSPAIAIFRANIENFSVQKFEFRPAQFKTGIISGWTVHVSKFLLSKLRGIRRQCLPSETGGVLIGCFDRVRHAVYIVDALPAPQDSIERPMLFIRGVRGLKNEIDRIKRATISNLDYVGEWHSHPPGCPPALSRIDSSELKALAGEMNLADLPGLMLILADNNRHGIFIR